MRGGVQIHKRSAPLPAAPLHDPHTLIYARQHNVSLPPRSRPHTTHSHTPSRTVTQSPSATKPAHTTSSAKLAPRKPEPAAASRYAHETPSTTARRSPPHGLKRPIRTRNPPITATTRKQLKPFRCTLCSRVICAPRSSPTTPHATAGKQNTRTSVSSAAT